MQEWFSKKERELMKLQHEYVSSIVASGKLTSQQCDWLLNEMTQKRDAARKIFTDALTRRLTAVKEKSAKRKRLVESEV